MAQTSLVNYPDALAYQWTGSMVGRDVGMLHQKLWEQQFGNENAQQQAAYNQQQAWDNHNMKLQQDAARRADEQHKSLLSTSDSERARKAQREDTIAGLAGSFGGFRRLGGKKSSMFRSSLLD